MKRIFSTLAILALATTFAPHAHAQTTLAVRGGLNLTTLGGDDGWDNLDYSKGFNLGAALQLGLTESMGLDVGATFSQKGAEETESGVTGSFDLSYLEVPVLLRFGSAAPLSVLIGPSFGINLSCEAGISGGGGSISGDCDDGTNTIDLGATAGLGIDLDVNESLVFQGRATYTHGLTDVFEDDAEDPTNRAFGFQVGLAFPIG